MNTYYFSSFKAVFSVACVSLFLAGCTANNPDSPGDGDDTIEVVTVESLNIQVKDLNKSLNEYKTTMNLLSSYVVELQNKVIALDGQGYSDLKSKVDALEGKVTAFENALKDLDGYTDLNTWVSNLNDGLNSLNTLQDAVNEAKTSITDIITRLNGLDQKTANIAGDLDAKTKQLTDNLSKCSTDISGMMDRLAALEENVGALQQEIAALISAVQSVVVVPDYAEGSVKMTDGKSNVLRFEVYPTTTAQKLAEVGPSAFSLDCVETETKASSLINIPITSVSFDGEFLSITADGSGLKQSIKEGTQPANARLRITDGKVTRSSEYFALTYKTSSGEPVSPADPSGDFIGAYALDDGTGLTDMYFSFFKGTLSNYSLKQAGKKVVLAEGCLWNTSPNDFSMDNTGEYAIEKGTIYLNGVPYGAVSFSDNQMILAGKTYTRFADFKSERYSVITVDGGLERTCDYTAQTLNVSVSVSRTIPSGKLEVESDSDWLVPGEYANGIYRFSVAGNPIHISRSAQVVFSYLEAETVTLSLCQEVNPLVKNLSASGSANSYVVSSAGTYSFRTTKGNSSTSVGTVSSAVVLWESYGTSTTPSVGSIINNVSYSSNTITFSTPTTLENGNAVIAAKDASGNILWSWHIWVCKDYDPAATAQEYSNNAGTMMDRNLGATSATPGNVGALGLLYQWGRKDPFLGSSSISSSTQAKSTLSTWPSPVSSNSSTGTIAYAVKNPTTFIMGVSGTNYDWVYSSRDNKLWQSAKTIYDPCPPGWKVPAGGSSGVWSKAANTSHTWDSTHKGMNFSGKFGSADTIWYPAAGYLGHGNCSLDYVGYDGYWWSCTPNDYYACCLLLGSNGNVNPSGDSRRASGLSVRCLQE